jgi:Tol biopolymer transport system component
MRNQVSPHTKPLLSSLLSPDGQKIVYETRGTEQHIWVYDIGRDISTQVVSEGISQWPIWTPDGNMIVFAWSDYSIPNIYIVPADGSKAMERLTTSQNFQFPSSISPDGNLLAYLDLRSDNFDILIYDFRDKTTTPFAATEHDECYPEFSPNGRWIAYCTNQEGRWEVYVRPSSGTGETIKVSREGGDSPLWARSGKRIFYQNRRGEQMWAADVQTEPSFSVGRPRLLFEKRGLLSTIPLRCYDISLDDRRFLMVRQEEREPRPVTALVLIQNWFEELKRLVPTGK